MIFVFGSNLAGRHGAGAAQFAYLHRGAVYGQGEGLQGESYAIPIKDGRNRAIPLTDPSQTLALPVVAQGVARFLAFARAHPAMRFKVTAVGCGLAGYKPHQIAPLFAGAPGNCHLPPQFRAVLERER
jgi:hypothetical protein